MTRIATSLAVLATTLALVLPAQAQLTRTFVSSTGSDLNPCTLAAPCRSFAGAFLKTADNGIIDALDPAGYGALDITTPITINGNGWATITAPASGNGTAIGISPSAGNVTLTGLEIDGAGAALNGITVIGGNNITISNCIIKDFIINPSMPAGESGNGIFITPLANLLHFTITNTTVLNNANSGIFYFPITGSATTRGVIDHVVATGNVGVGIWVNLTKTTGAADVAISNSIASNNGTGIQADGTVTVIIDNTTVKGNFGTGIQGDSPANVALTRSVIEGNQTGIANVTSAFYTYGNNLIDFNTTNITNPPLNTATL